jgi:hypothetical protein
MTNRLVWKSEFVSVASPEVFSSDTLACRKCETVKFCLNFDNSSGEYSPVTLCLRCISVMSEQAYANWLPHRKRAI